MTGKAAFWLLSLLLLACPARAQWVVTDPTSYTYYVEQLKQAAKALETAKETADGIKQVNSEITGAYGRAKGMVDDLKRAQEALKNGDLLKRALEMGGQPTDTGFVDISKVLDGTYGDARTRGYKGGDKRAEVQQQALKDVISDSDKLLQGIGDRLERTKKLAAQVDSTANIKDAMDLNNRISLEILQTLIDMLAIAAKNNQAQALFNYSGVTDSGTAERTKVLTDAAKQMKSVEAVWGKSKYGNGMPRFGF